MNDNGGATQPAKFTVGAEYLIKGAHERLDRLEKRIEERFQESQSRLITVFGIFASFITFVTIEFQILRSASDMFLVFSFSSFLLAGMLMFATTLNNLIKGEESWRALWKPSSLLIICLLAISVIFVMVSLDRR